MLKKRSLPIFVFLSFFVLTAPAHAAGRTLTGTLPGTQIAGLDDQNQPVITPKTIRWSFQDDNSWKMQCGRYVMNYMILRLSRYNRVEQANILSNIDEIVIREPESGIFGSTAPAIQYRQKKKQLVIEFSRDPNQSGINYCNMSTVRTAWARYERWSGRGQQVDLTLPAPSEAPITRSSVTRPVEVRPDYAALDRATQEALARSMAGVLTPAPAPTVPCPQAPQAK